MHDGGKNARREKTYPKTAEENWKEKRAFLLSFSSRYHKK
jgi:hypothetical protein